MLVLFDIDDTLLDHAGAVRAGVTSLHAAIQPPAPLADFLASWHTAMREHFPRYLFGAASYQDQRRARMRQTVSPTLSDAQADELFTEYFRAYEAHWELFDDVRPCLDSLTGHRLGIISNGNGDEQRSKLARTGIAGRFELVHISNDRGHAKPSAEIFRGACDAAGVDVRDAVYIGDLYEIDAVGSRRAGLHGVWLNRSQSSVVDPEPPVIQGLGELAGLLRSLGATRSFE